MGRHVETYRGIVYPWQCDAMGHLNTQHYVGIFDQTLLQLVAELGYVSGDGPHARRGWADVKTAWDLLVLPQ